MIDRIKLKFGASSTAAALEFAVTPITIFVGPNHSGKSKLIREIAELFRHGSAINGKVIADEIQLRAYSREEAESALAELELAPIPGDRVFPDHVLVGRNGVRNQVLPSQMINAL